ncbi:hypothetical protein Tco_0690624 [Tanacetum coccineum]
MEEDQAGPDPGISYVALAGPDPEPTHDEFMVDLYPKVQESLKFPADEHVILEDPLSLTRTLSSMKNMDGMRKEFIHAIERRLNTRRIFRNLECFVGGRVRDIDYRLLQRTRLVSFVDV